MASVATALDGDVWTITLDRPAAGNAIDLTLASELATAVRDRPAVSRVVVLVGAGKRFCVGGDIAAFAGSSDPGVFVGALASGWHVAVRELLTCPVPTVLGVHGAIAGAAVGLLGVCDIVVCARSTVIRPAYAGIGFSPDGGTSWVLTRALGPQRALDLMLTNASLTAEAAAEAGLVARVVDDVDLSAAVAGVARQLANGPLAALARTRQLVRAADTRSLTEHLDEEARLIAESAGDDDGREGVRAFTERRTPDFRRGAPPT